MRDTTRRLSALSIAVLLMTACGGDGSVDTTPTTEASGVTPTQAEGETTTTQEPPGEAPPIAGTWAVTHYASAETNGITNLWPDTEIALVIGEDGSISGNAGCNDYTGTYEVSGSYIAEPGFEEELGQAIEVGEIFFDGSDCLDENTMTQEAEYLDVLGQADYWNIGSAFGDGDMNLILRSVDDGLLVQGSPSG